MMDELIKEVVRLVAEEHKRAAAEHGAAAHSPHEVMPSSKKRSRRPRLRWRASPSVSTPVDLREER